jgi:hypothetical protein
MRLKQGKVRFNYYRCSERRHHISRLALQMLTNTTGNFQALQTDREHVVTRYLSDNSWAGAPRLLC